MKPWKTFLTLLIFFISTAVASGSETDSLMQVLEDVLLKRDEYVGEKEKSITDMKQRLEKAGNNEDRYRIIGELFEAYKPFNTDSAYYYSLQRERVAHSMGDSIRVLDARMNQASTLRTVGMYHEAWMIMKDIKPSMLSEDLIPYYYYIVRTLKGDMADYSAFSPIRVKYNAETCAYRDSIIRVNEPGSLAQVLSIADQHNAYGRYQKAVDVMSRFMATHELSDHDKAICAWTLADSYQHLGNIPELKKQLIISSIGDMKAAVREYVSLRQLALLLYKEGDLERAYRFMNISLEDAQKSNARQRLVELSASYPEITEIYVDKIQNQSESLRRALWVIGVLAVVLVLALLYVWKQMRTIHKNNIKLKDMNLRLNEMNSQLNKAVERLNHANEQLKEAYHEVEENSRIKEAYIGKYMDQCINQIDSIDSYRKSLLKLATAGKNEELRAKLKATDALEDSLKEFYANFDSTFLDLFPDFIENFNALLIPEEAIIPKRKGTLNTELRIFALIRLGITDSDKIARFLRYSVTTIYNYRTKVRNKARGDRTLLEEAVKAL